MRYSQITLAKYYDRENWMLIHVEPLSVKSIVKSIRTVKKTLNFKDMTIVFTSKEVVDVFLSENHPLFNINVIDRKFESAPQYKSIEEQVSKQFDILIKNHSKK